MDFQNRINPSVKKTINGVLGAGVVWFEDFKKLLLTLKGKYFACKHFSFKPWKQ